MVNHSYSKLKYWKKGTMRVEMTEACVLCALSHLMSLPTPFPCAALYPGSWRARVLQFPHV